MMATQTDTPARPKKPIYQRKWVWAVTAAAVSDPAAAE